MWNPPNFHLKSTNKILGFSPGFIAPRPLSTFLIMDPMRVDVRHRSSRNCLLIEQFYD